MLVEKKKDKCPNGLMLKKHLGVNVMFKPSLRAATRHLDCNLRLKVNPPSRC